LTAVALKRVMRIVAGQSPPSEEVSDFEGSGLPFLQGNAEFGSRNPAAKHRCDSAPKRAEVGDVLLSVRAPVGALNIADRQYGIGRGLAALRPTAVEPRFAWWALHAAVDQLRASATGSTFEAITADDIGRLTIELPSPSTQQQIAASLDAETARIDALIEKKRRMAELLRERAVVATQDIVLGRGNGRATAFSGIDSIGEIPDDWRIIRNKVFMREIDERSIDGDEELLTVSHITGVTPRAEKDVSMFMAESLEGYKLVEPRDLVVNTMWAWMGALGISRYAGIVSPSYAVYRIDSEQAVPRFVDAMFRSPAYIAEITRMSKGVWTSRLRLYPEALLAMKTPIPPLPEQRGIVAQLDGYLARLKPAAERLERSVMVLRERRQAVITAAVTEKIPVAKAPA
jgi:type I restriction enzyme, S subunit